MEEYDSIVDFGGDLTGALCDKEWFPSLTHVRFTDMDFEKDTYSVSRWRRFRALNIQLQNEHGNRLNLPYKPEIQTYPELYRIPTSAHQYKRLVAYEIVHFEGGRLRLITAPAYTAPLIVTFPCIVGICSP